MTTGNVEAHKQSGVGAAGAAYDRAVVGKFLLEECYPRFFAVVLCKPVEDTVAAGSGVLGCSFELLPSSFGCVFGCNPRIAAVARAAEGCHDAEAIRKPALWPLRGCGYRLDGDFFWR